MVLKVLKERIEEMEDILKEKTKITPVWHKIPQCPANAKRIGRDKDSATRRVCSGPPPKVEQWIIRDMGCVALPLDPVK